MANTPSGDTPPPQSAGSRGQDDDTRDCAPGSSTRSRASSRDAGRDRGADADRGSRPDGMTPREREERWPLG